MSGGTPQVRGYSGEQDMGFYFGERGYYIVEGPSGASGHRANASGFDGVAYNPKTRNLILYDNKSFKRQGNVSSATAIDTTRNLGKNLDGLIQRVSRMNQLPDQKAILSSLRRTRDAVQQGAPWPGNVKIAVSNAGGCSTGVTSRLSNRGIQFIDFYKVTPILRRRRLDGIAAVLGELLGSGIQWIGDIGIERQVREALETQHRETIESIFARGEGVLVIVHHQEWAIPNFLGSRARGLLGVYVEGGRTEEEAKQRWFSTSKYLQGPSDGWRVGSRTNTWIPFQW